jgi:hypothetical protein
VAQAVEGFMASCFLAKVNSKYIIDLNIKAKVRNIQKKMGKRIFVILSYAKISSII